ncbi:hypothetical protein Nans01_29940 [Nocardiopsis ansamitocini]|uniref:Uncharacterized protein n=1 Tax=Nocardiopsis ansamitocini TaxID=1670832 RepID=A0A9W6P7W1_9ACTN|nr:hypothetical protein Nans01_29940 [Nocardiopsis ansamitocini]
MSRNVEGVEGLGWFVDTQSGMEWPAVFKLRRRGGMLVQGAVVKCFGETGKFEPFRSILFEIPKIKNL